MNARSKRKSVTVVVASIGRSAVAASGQPDTHRTNPTRSISDTTATNPYVGIAKSEPASFTPRRLASVTSSTRPIAIGTRRCSREGAADVIATVPAVMLTATVRT